MMIAVSHDVNWGAVVIVVSVIVLIGWCRWVDARYPDKDEEKRGR